MISCYKCKKEITEVHDIGELIRSFDGNDFCFCRKCQQELEQSNKESLEAAAAIEAKVDPIKEEEEDESYVLDEMAEYYAFADEGIYPIGDGHLYYL